MDPITRQAIAVAGGAAGSSGPLYVDDVFSTFLYDGNGTNQTINNGIDISGEGGLVWVKNRSSSSYSHVLAGPDLVSANYTNLASDLSNQAGTESNYVTGFSSNGFSVGNSGSVNDSTDKYCSWTFRKAPGFFDVVTWSGNNVDGRNISHSLGSTPGMIWMKPISSGGGWYVHHRSLGFSKSLALNSSSNDSFGAACTAASSTTFTVQSTVNASGTTYIAYVFAHDDQSFGTNSDEAIIKCGTYSGTGSAGNHIDVGFEPQWLLIKNSGTSNTNWVMFDVMRGMPAIAGSTAVRLDAHLTQQENLNNSVEPSPTGFTPTGAGSYTNATGGTYVYMAIRRSHKPSTTATDVFNTTTYTGNQTRRIVAENSNLTDLAFLIDRDATSQNYSAYAHYVLTRLHGPGSLGTAQTGGQVTGWNAYFDFDVNKGLELGPYNYQNKTGTDYVLYTFTRAPGFFDVLAYTGTGSSRNLSHNLGAVPELIIQKRKDTTGEWHVFANPVVSPNSAWYLNFGNLNRTYSLENNFGSTGISGAPTSTVIPLGNSSNLNGSSRTFMMYLFASLDGISKVGAYSGTGYDINVDCGFTNGARFVMIKQTNGSGDWYVWDTARGIVSGNDPYSLFNSSAVEVTNTDYIDPLNAGFTVTSSAPAALNTSGGTYLFLAIA